MDKQDYIDKYNAFKKLNDGKIPLRPEFLKFTKTNKRDLARAFGSESYSSLQIECGDEPNRLETVRTPVVEILEKYGNLTKECKHKPKHDDWLGAHLTPGPEALRKTYGLSFSNFPEKFIEHFKDIPEW